MPFPAPPTPFLTVKVHEVLEDPVFCALCAGYEGGIWRAEAFAAHAMEWLPEFCLSAEELEEFRPGTALALLRKSARLVYQTDKYKLRGEFGELFLHIALRQVHNSIPAISKLYWKDAVNNTVKGYDAVHVVETSGKLELWLGEVKFYSDANRAIRDVVSEIKDHTALNYLKNEVAIIANKLDKTADHYATLSRLLDPNTSLDDVFDAACIPVLITYDSAALKGHKKSTPQYVKALADEVSAIQKTLREKLEPLALPVRVHLFLVPLNTKSGLLKILDSELKRLQ